MRLRSLLAFGVGHVLGSEAGCQRYEQNLAAAKRAQTQLDEYGRQTQLDEYGRKLEQFSNQPTR